jgi:competence protein ComEA
MPPPKLPVKCTTVGHLNGGYANARKKRYNVHGWKLIGGAPMLKHFRPIAIIAACLIVHAFAPASQKDGPVGKVNINSATRTELIQIPKIGEKMADRIVEFRKANGPFTRIEEIMNVKGMGEKTFLSIKLYLTVGAQSKKPTGQATKQAML